MRFLVLATDYDGTLAHDGIVTPQSLKALARFRESGRKLVMVTGRRLGDLIDTFPELDSAFDMVVAENGALLYSPGTKEAKVLSEAPLTEFVEALRRRNVSPLAVGHVIVATLDDQKEKVLDAIQELGLELQLIFNKGALMILPSGVNKASGLDAALKLLGFSARNTVGVGDAENDHAFLKICEVSAAVRNALPSLKDRADVLLDGDHGRGVEELMERILKDELAGVRLARNEILLGASEDGREVRLPAYGGGLLIAGTSGGGKSTLTGGILERLTEQGYQFCGMDPEGDFSSFEGAVVLGDAKHAPAAEEILSVLDDPSRSVIVNLLGIPFESRPQFFECLLPRLQERRAASGRPHWIVVDEAHHLLPSTWEAAGVVLPTEMTNLVLITLEPNHIAAPVLNAVELIVAVGEDPGSTIQKFADAVGVAAPEVGDIELEKGTVLAWWKDGHEPPVRFQVAPSKAKRVRHSRKYAEAELTADRSFFFRGPEAKLNLRAQNLLTFLQLMDGVDEATWLHHFHSGEISAWFRKNIKNNELADEAVKIESQASLNAEQSRAKFRELVEARYTMPA